MLKDVCFSVILHCVCVCKHLVTRCRIFRGHLLGKTTCADFWFAFSVTFRHVRICVFYFEICKQGGSESHSIHCPTKTVVWDCDIFEGRLEDVPANFELFELFTSCCNTVFPSEFPSNFRRTISDHVDHDLYFDELPFGPSRTMLIFSLLC